MKKLPKITVTDVERELCNRSLSFFVRTFWDVIVPNELIWNWHMDVLCDEIQSVYELVFLRKPKENDLIFNVPPGTSKTKIVSVFATCWAFSRKPDLRIFVGSYSDQAVLGISDDIRLVIRSDKFKRLYPKTIVRNDKDSTHIFKTTVNGEFYAFTVGGTITSKHADILVIDDPLNPKQAASKAALDEANFFFDKTLPTRKVDKTVTPTILVMQRLSIFDPTANLLKKNIPIRHISLPATLDGKNPKVKPEELKHNYTNGLLDELRLNHSALNELKESLGSFGYSAQIEQDALPEGGGILKKEWFTIIKKEAAPQGCAINFQLDTAYTKKENNDPSAMISYFTHGNNLYLTNSISVRKEFPELCKWIPEHTREHGYNEYSTIRVEPKASGIPVVDSLNVETNLNIIKDKAPTVDKITRAKNCSPKVESGRVILLEGHWNESFLSQVAAFPNAAHDDELDCLTAIIERELINNSNNGEYVFG